MRYHLHKRNLSCHLKFTCQFEEASGVGIATPFLQLEAGKTEHMAFTCVTMHTMSL